MQKPDVSEIYSSSYTEPEKISLHMKLCYAFDEDDRWHLHIIIDEMATAEELRTAWGRIDQARQELKRYQGSDPNWFSIALLSYLENEGRKKPRPFYADLAMDLNFDALVYMLWATDERKGNKHKKAGLMNFVNLFLALGMKIEEIRKWEKEGRESINNGKLPWGVSTESYLESPIKRRKIIDALKQLRKEKLSQKIIQEPSEKIVQKPTNDLDLITQIRIFSLVYKYWEEAANMLKRFAPDEHHKYEKRLVKRTAELLRQAVEFSGLNPP